MATVTVTAGVTAATAVESVTVTGNSLVTLPGVSATALVSSVSVWNIVNDSQTDTWAPVAQFQLYFILPPTGTWSSPVSGTWTVPSNVHAIRVEAIGSGGIGSGGGGAFFGGGGGAYARTDYIAVTPGQTVYYRTIGSNDVGGSADSWLNTLSNTAPTSKDHGVLAKAGGSGVSAGGIGGQASACIGDVAFSGGNGGASAVGTNNGGGGGGGAAGPNGPGANGGSGFGATIDGSGGGGGANSGFSGESASIALGKGGNGGNNRFGAGGGAAGTQTVLAQAGINGGGGGGSYAGSTGGDFRRGAAGSAEIIWTDSLTSATAGPGAGGGGSRGLQAGGAGANYGGGAGATFGFTGAGLVVITARYSDWSVVSDAQTVNWQQVVT